MVRNITEIIKDVNNTNDLKRLINLWNEIAKNKKKYTLADIWNAREQIISQSFKTTAPELEIGKFALFLILQSENKQNL